MERSIDQYRDDILHGLALGLDVYDVWQTDPSKVVQPHNGLVFVAQHRRTLVEIEIVCSIASRVDQST